MSEVLKKRPAPPGWVESKMPGNLKPGNEPKTLNYSDGRNEVHTDWLRSNGNYRIVTIVEISPQEMMMSRNPEAVIMERIMETLSKANTQRFSGLDMLRRKAAKDASDEWDRMEVERIEKALAAKHSVSICHESGRLSFPPGEAGRLSHVEED